MLDELENGLLASSYISNSIILIWDTTNGKLKYNFDQSNGGHENIVVSLAAFDREFLASRAYDRKIKIWDLKEGKLIYTFDSSNGSHSNRVSSIGVLENGYLASSCDDGLIKVWDIFDN